MSAQTDMSIQLFMQATILLSNYYGFQTVQYSMIQERSARAGFNTLPFMPPETVRATPELVGFANQYENNPQLLNEIVAKYGGYKSLVKYYIRTGLRASQLICRNHLLGLEENNQYLEFLRKEFGVAYTLATGILELAHGNRTLQGAFLISRSFVDGAIGVYEEYRFLNVDREAARTLVETAQNKYAEYYLGQVDEATPQSNSTAGGYTFSDAINAVSVIEYQCTREGIRQLLNRSINNSPTNMEIDGPSGTIMFRSTVLDSKAATGNMAPPVKRVPNAAPPPVPAAVIPTGPAVVAVTPPVVVPATKNPTVRPCVAPPDEQARQLIAFVCPAGLMNNANRLELGKLLQQIDPAMAGKVMTVLSVQRHAPLREQLLEKAKAAGLIQ